MSERTNEDIIRIVKKWQDGPLIHELACANDERHPLLTPIERDGKVVLICLKCGYVRVRIPDEILDAEATLDFAAVQAAAWARRETARSAAADVWWAVAVIMTCCIVFGGMFLGWPGAILGVGIGACIAGPYSHRKLKKIRDDFESRP